MSYTVDIILVDAAVTVPIKLTGAAIAHFIVNTFEESFPIGVWRQIRFLLCQKKRVR